MGAAVHLSLNVLPQKGIQQLYNSLDFILSSQSVSLERGHSKLIFGDRNKRVRSKSLGVRPERTAKGVLNYDQWATRIGIHHWQHVMRMVRRAELLFESFADNEVGGNNNSMELTVEQQMLSNKYRDMVGLTRT